MEIRTTVKNFSQQVKYHHISPDTYIRVIINELEPVVKEHTKIGSSILQMITPEEQRYRLNLLPSEYHPESSEELIRVIEESHTNTDNFKL